MGLRIVNKYNMLQGAEMLKRNLHAFDRLLRVVVGVVCVYFGFIDTSYISQNTVAILIGIIGVTNLFAAVSGFCPLYGATGLSTYKENPDKNHEA